MLNVFTLSNGRLFQEEIESLEELSKFRPIWVDLEDPTPEEKRWVRQYYGLSIPEDAIDDDIDIVLIGFLQLGQVFIFQHLPAYAKTHKTLGLQRGKIAGEFAFFLAGDGRQQHQLGAIGQGHHAIDHLADGLRR